MSTAALHHFAVDCRPIPTAAPPALSVVATSDMPAPTQALGPAPGSGGERYNNNPWHLERSGQATLRALCGLDQDFGPQITPTDELPDAQVWAARLGLAILEAACGARPALQVMRWVSPGVYESLVRRSSRAVQHRRATRRPMRVRRVRVCHPCDGAVEATVVIEDHQRVRALALRMEGVDGRWIITHCRIG